MAARLQKEDAYFDSVCAAARNPMDALLRMSAAMYDAFDAMGWEFAEDVSYYPSAIDALHAERRALRKRQRAVFMRGVDEGYLLGEAYYGLLEKLFWQNFSVGNRDREAAMRMLFTVVRGSATAEGWQEAELVRQEMGLGY